MGKLEYLVIHCSATPAKMIVTKAMLEEWHLGPLDLPGGRVKYRGKEYPSRRELPKDLLNGKVIEQVKGRGWDRLGYSVLIHRNGMKEIITAYNNDDIIESHEMTWGATGINAISRHVCLEGGGDGKELVQFDDLFTESQKVTLINYIKEQRAFVPKLKVAGHNEFTKKACPGFKVASFLENNLL